MIVSLFMFGVNSSRTYTFKKVRQKQPVGLKKKGKNALMWPRTNHWQTQHAFPNSEQKNPGGKEKNKHTPLHSTLKNQSRSSPCSQNHTVAANGGRGAGGGEKGGEWKDLRRKRITWKDEEKKDADQIVCFNEQRRKQWKRKTDKKKWDEEWEIFGEGEGKWGLVSLVSTSACWHWFS